MLLRKRPAIALGLLVGDLNVNMLPVHRADPWQDLPDRAETHKQQRMIMYAMEEATGYVMIENEKTFGILRRSTRKSAWRPPLHVCRWA